MKEGRRAERSLFWVPQTMIRGKGSKLGNNAEVLRNLGTR